MVVEKKRTELFISFYVKHPSRDILPLMALLNEADFMAESTGDSRQWILGDNYNMESEVIGSMASVKTESMTEEQARIKLLILDRIHVLSKITDEFLSEQQHANSSDGFTAELFRRGFCRGI